MIHSIIESISRSIYTEFGDAYNICREAKKQGLKKPCFFISCINPTDRLFLNRRYFRRNPFCIQYFPADSLRGNEECMETAERLFVCLEYLDVGGDWVMGTKMKYEVVDGILHFFVNYDMFVYRTAETVPVMEEVSSETSVKG